MPKDLVHRCEPIIMQLEREDNVLVVTHQAISRCIFAYFMNQEINKIPYINIPLHTIIKLTPYAYGCHYETIPFDIEAVDTHYQYK
ncbi:hypothetical protein A3Q56_08536 [Intoshia linei]|uniref:Uncharacterized protein n=1 Tax=Intoshia linei TaxID=1819745 RepID=A0A177AR72_9BILA|nr:hypothetical protein A3Q56_08536 [Intoshia linei]